MIPLLDQLIEEAALIWLHERDGMPCSIRRARLRLMCHEFAAAEPLNTAMLNAASRPRQPDRKMLAAHDDSFEA